jgi:hypothetical protein
MTSYVQFDVWQSTAGVNRQSVLQTKYALKTSTWSSSVSNDTTYDVPGLSVTITPYFSTSLILITTTLYAGSQNMYNIKYRLARNGTYPIQGDAESGRPRSTGYINQYTSAGYAEYGVGNVGGTHIDTPGSTSAITYSVQLGSYGSQAIYLNRSYTYQNNAASGYDPVPVSSIIVQEIAQ